MSEDYTIKDMTEKVERASTTFERTNTELKRRYLVWNIDVFNQIARLVSVSKGSFGTGYPFYALDENLEGELPVIEEQIRYNRQLVRDGKPIQKSIWKCKSCLEQNYDDMPDLKRICKPCPNVIPELKPRKFINRLPDIDMWLVCEDEKVEEAQQELTRLLDEYKMSTSDKAPLASIDDVSEVAEMIKNGKFPKIFLPIDSHIIEYSKIKKLLEQVPDELQRAKQEDSRPYLPIWPKSYRKEWQYDDEAYNFIYDYLSAFTDFNFPQELKSSLDESRKRVVSENTPEELHDFLMQSATSANFRRFQSLELEDIFMHRISTWKDAKSTRLSSKEDNESSDSISRIGNNANSAELQSQENKTSRDELQPKENKNDSDEERSL